MSDNSIVIKSNAVFSNDVFNIAIANFRRSEYVDESGQTVNGQTAAMYVYHKENQTEDSPVRVYEGFSTVIDGYQIVVLDITSDTVQIELMEVDE